MLTTDSGLNLSHSEPVCSEKTGSLLGGDWESARRRLGACSEITKCRLACGNPAFRVSRSDTSRGTFYPKLVIRKIIFGRVFCANDRLGFMRISSDGCIAMNH